MTSAVAVQVPELEAVTQRAYRANSRVAMLVIVQVISGLMPLGRTDELDALLDSFTEYIQSPGAVKVCFLPRLALGDSLVSNPLRDGKHQSH